MARVLFFDMTTKVCAKCKEVRSIIDFRINKRAKDGRQSRCKKCGSRHPDEYDERIAKNASGLKYCSVCDRWLPYSEYRNSKQAKDGKHSTCKDCRDNYIKQWRIDNAEKQRRKQQEYYLTPAGLASKARTRHKRKSATTENTLTDREWSAVLVMQENTCLGCGNKFTDANPATRDHIVPIAFGGGLTLDNCQALCRSCNSRKGKRIVVDYRPSNWKEVISQLL